MSHIQTQTYFLFHDTPNGPVPFYVGEALDPQARLKQHRRDAANYLNGKEAYEFLRVSNIKDFGMEVVDGKSEDELYTELTLAGFKLFNAKRGNASALKKRRATSEFTRLNREAAATLSIKERAEASGRRNRLHGDTQNLSKSEIVRSRLLNRTPTLEELMACQWNDVPPELLGVKVARTAERAEHCKFGDYDLFIAFRKKDRHTACVARHRVKPEFFGNGAGYTECGKQRTLELLIENWDDNRHGFNS